MPLNGNGNTDRSYVITAVDGTFEGVIGTSVSSPELAGATARLIEQYGRMGNLNPYIYATSQIQTASGENNSNRSTRVFHHNIPGYNGVVTRWDVIFPRVCGQRIGSRSNWPALA